MTEFSVLGPIEVWAHGQRVDAGQPRQRAVLAALLADAGRDVPVDTLVDRVWGEAPPRGARPSLHAHITRIRQLIPVPVVFAAGCYRLEIDPVHVDLHHFRQLAGQARAPELSAEQRVEMLREAVRLWRGEPLAGLSGPWAAQARQTWGQEYLAVAVAWGEAELRVANADAVIAVLSDLAAEHPLTESLAVVLMRALAAAGRPAEALARYEVVRRRLVTELGTDPSAELQETYQSILHGAAPAEVPAALAQLPADLAGFVGRTGQMQELTSSVRSGAATVAIFAVSGTAGVGKTAFAVHWAHSVAHHFPDGQLYVNLRGFDAGGRVVDAGDAVRGFLDALGVAKERVPSGLDAQAALYRSLLAGRRILVLLDNARDAEQVRPLLPATAGAVALVTSRNQLTGLLAAEDAHSVRLDVLPEADAHELLSRRVGADRTVAEPEAVRAIIAACARLPLALAITAAQARQTSFPLAAIAAELTGERLDALDIGDPAVQVRAVFSWSYAALSADAGRLFRLLGLHPGPDISTAAAAGLAGQSVSRTRRLLGELTSATLLVEHVPGRYLSHDLLRAYAAELTEENDPAPDRRAATVRLLDHYVHTAHTADRLMYPSRDPIELPLGPVAEGSHPEDPRDQEQAMTWFSAERPVLLAAARWAAEHGFDSYAWQLAWVIDTFLFRRGHWYERIAVWSIALPAADRLGDLDVLSIAHRTVARARVVLGQTAEARADLEKALELSVRSGNQAAQANVHNNLALMATKEEDYRLAVRHNEHALALYRAVESPRGQAAALSGIGWNYDLMGEYEKAITPAQQALELLQQAGDLRGQADNWDSIGYAHHHLGRYATAADCFQHALDLAREIGDRAAEGEILMHLGEPWQSSGEFAAARAAWDEALQILTELDMPEAKEVRTKLDGLP